MKQINGLFLTALLTVLATLSACSSSQTQVSLQDVGNIIAIKTIQLPSEKINPLGNVGVSAGSGGHSGIYASLDFATIGKIFSKATKPNTTQQIIVKKANGDTIAITQPPSEEQFKVGDRVRLLMVNGEARVSH